MKIEILYPERCNLYGDLANMDYLRKCLPQAEFVETPLGETPQFAREKVDMVYLGPMTEQAQEQALEQLFPLKERLQELVEQDVVFLCTGNALELFGEAIFKEDGSRIPCLGLFPLTAGLVLVLSAKELVEEGEGGGTAVVLLAVLVVVRQPIRTFGAAEGGEHFIGDGL